MSGRELDDREMAQLRAHSDQVNADGFRRLLADNGERLTRFGYAVATGDGSVETIVSSAYDDPVIAETLVDLAAIGLVIAMEALNERRREASA